MLTVRSHRQWQGSTVVPPGFTDPRVDETAWLGGRFAARGSGDPHDSRPGGPGYRYFLVGDWRESALSTAGLDCSGCRIGCIQQLAENRFHTRACAMAPAGAS